MPFRLALSAGHYLKTQKGCIKTLDPNETREWTLNDRIADKLEKILSEYDGIEVLRLDDTDGIKSVNNSKRVQIANEWGADLYLSIHHNAAGSDGKPHNASGICAFVRQEHSEDDLRWAIALYDASVKYTGLKGNRSQAVWEANFEEVRLPKMPAVLMENGFMDSPTDVPIILSREFSDAVAKAYSEVIVKMSGAKKRSDAADPLAPGTSASSNTETDDSSEHRTNTSPDAADTASAATEITAGIYGNATVTVPILGSGSRGPEVRNLQRLLNIYGCTDSNGHPLAVDGSFGPATMYALKVFQRANSLTADGYCGPATWTGLLRN